MNAAETPDRIEWLDALRGAAVLGIIPLNARWLLHPQGAYFVPALEAEPGWIAWLWWAWPELLLDHSTLFALSAVFGISLALSRDRAGDTGWRRRHVSRLVVLGAFGFAHGALLWPGDILYPYALTALILTASVGDRKTGAGGLGWVALALATAPLVIDGTATAISIDYYGWTDNEAIRAYEARSNEAQIEESAAYTGTFAQAQAMRWEQWTRQITTVWALATVWTVAGGMLAGLWWWRRGRHLRLPARTVPAIMSTGLALTSTSIIVNTVTGWHPTAITLGEGVTYIGGILLTAGAVVWCSRQDAHRWTTPAGKILRGCGQASLSIYLTANVACAAVAQGWGLGLHGELPPEQTAATVSAVMILCALIGLGQSGTADRLLPERAWRAASRALSGRAGD